MGKRFWHSFTLALILCLAASFLIDIQAQPTVAHAANEPVSVWLTTGDQANLLSQQSNLSFTSGTPGAGDTIAINENEAYQQIDGFGANFSDLAAGLMWYNMSSTQRNNLLNYLFSSSSGVGFSVMRLALGSNDQVYNSTYHLPTPHSYDDNGGTPDPSLSNFSISHDLTYTVPELQQAMGIEPGLKILGTPWIEPAWMETNDTAACGTSRPTLSPSYYQTFANYIVKFIQAYSAQGIPIWAMTPQNEPNVCNSNPPLNFSAGNEAALIDNALGPTLAADEPGTGLLDYDSNWGSLSFPQSILSDATARSYLWGTAWHGYVGSPSDMSTLQSEYPSQGQYFTEYGSATWPPDWSKLTSSSEGADKIVQIMRNWGKTFLWHALASDTNADMGTCDAAQGCAPLLRIDPSTGNVTYDPPFYALAQFSKFVRSGASRIDSTEPIENVAFKNPDGSKVLVVVNTDLSNSHTFSVVWGNEYFTYTLPQNSVVTFTWGGTPSSTITVDDSVQGSGYNQFNYSGSGWGHCTNCDSDNLGRYDASNSWDTNAGDSFSVEFNGTGITLYTCRGLNTGYMDVSVDGGTATTIDTYSATPACDQSMDTISGLSPGTHTLKVVVDGTHDSNSSGTYVIPDRVDILSAFTEVDDSVQGSGTNQFNYSGSGWGHCTSCDFDNIGRYDASNSWDSTAGDSFSVQFSGTGIGLYLVEGATTGLATVSIDGGAPTQIDTYSPQGGGNQFAWAVSGLSEGSHTLKVVVEGKHDASSGGDYIIADRVEILP